MAVAFTSILIPEFLGLPLIVMSVPEHYSGATILDAPKEAVPILPIQGGGARTRAMAEAEAAAKAAADAAAEAEAKLKAKAGAKLKTNTNVDSVITGERGSEGGSTDGETDGETEEEDENEVPEANKTPVDNSKLNVTVGPKTVKLMKGFRVRLPEKYKDKIMNLDFTEEEQRLFNEYLKFNKPFIINYIKESEESKEEFYDFWKLFVEKDGTDGFTLMTKLEGRKIQNYMENIVYAHREYLIQSALRILRKQDNPQQFEDLLNPPEEDGFLFTTVGVGTGTSGTSGTSATATAVNDDEAKEKLEDPDFNEKALAEAAAIEEAEEEEAEGDVYEEEEEEEKKKAPAEDKLKDFKELIKFLNVKGANEDKLNNVINYLTTTFPKDKYPRFKTLMGVKTGSHFDVNHPRVNLQSFFDLYRENRDSLTFYSLLNLLIRIKIDSIKDVDLRDSFKEFFTSHIYNDKNGYGLYRERVDLYIQGKI